MGRRPVLEVRSEDGEPLLSVRLLPVLFGLGAATVAVIAVLAALLLPTLGRVDDAVTALAQAAPALQEMPPDLRSVDRNIDDEVVPAMQGLDGDLADLGDRVGEINDPLTRVEARLERLQGSIDGLAGPIESLPMLREDIVAMGEDLDAVRGGIDDVVAGLDGTQRSISDLVTLMERLTGSFDRVVALLDETEQHVENLDRKTGPAPPGVGD